MKIVIMLLSHLTTGMLVGNEWAVALFVHPVLYSVRDEAHVRVAKPLARRLGRFMPFWYAISLVLAILQLLVVGRGALLSWWLCCAAAILLGLIIVLTIALPVPINNQIAMGSRSIARRLAEHAPALGSLPSRSSAPAFFRPDSADPCRSAQPGDTTLLSLRS